MGSKSKAPDYATATYNTGGLFGSSTASKSGVDFKANDQMTQAGNTAWGGLNTSLNNLGSNDYVNDPNFQQYQNAMNKQMQQNYDTSVLSNLANRGLMRSSGLQGATNSFANTLADQTTNLMDSYYNRNANNLANYQNVLNSLYNYITGVNTGASNQANKVSNYNLQQVAYNNSLSNGGGLAGGLSGAVNGAMAGSSLGPWGASGGALIGGTAGALR